MFTPKSRIWLRQYSWDFFKKDLFAGISVGMISLPLAMAFAIASGVAPEKGLATAVVAGFLISALGGSRVQVGGPTGAFVVMVYGIVQRTGYDGLVLSTMIAALILGALGWLRLGSWIRFVPHSLIVGFTAGIAGLIFSSQVPDFLGLRAALLPDGFFNRWIFYFHSWRSLNVYSLCVGAGSLVWIAALRFFVPRVPWGIATLVLTTLVCQGLDWPVETVQSKFGVIPASFISFRLPDFSLWQSRPGEILFDGCMIAFLGALESLLCCVIADRMIGGKHKPNCELVGQGVANFCSALFGGIPATGAIARTSANIRLGAKTPVAGMIHAVVLLLIVLCFSPMVGKVPLSALAAVLITVSLQMGEWRQCLRCLRNSTKEAVICSISFSLTLLVDLVSAICAGMLLQAILKEPELSPNPSFEKPDP